MKSNPFTKSNPFQVPTSISHTKITSSSNQYYQPSTYDNQNILQQHNYMYSHNDSNKVNYLNPTTNKHNQSIQLPLSIKQNNYIKKYDNQIWKFNQNNCNKNKLFNGHVSNVSSHNVIIGQKNSFQKELVINSIKKHISHHNQQQKQKYQKIAQNPFNRKYLLSSNNNNLVQSVLYNQALTNPLVNNNINNNDKYYQEYTSSNNNIKLQKTISAYNNNDINYQYKDYNNYQYNLRKSIQKNNNAIYNNDSYMNDNSLKINQIQSSYDIDNKNQYYYNYNNNQYKNNNGSIKNMNLPPHNPNSSQHIQTNKNIQPTIHKNSRLSRDSRASKKSIEKVKFDQSDQQQTPRMRKSESVKINLSKQQIQQLQAGPKILNFKGKQFYKQQIRQI